MTVVCMQMHERFKFFSHPSGCWTRTPSSGTKRCSTIPRRVRPPPKTVVMPFPTAKNWGARGAFACNSQFYCTRHLAKKMAWRWQEIHGNSIKKPAGGISFPTFELGFVIPRNSIRWARNWRHKVISTGLHPVLSFCMFLLILLDID